MVQKGKAPKSPIQRKRPLKKKPLMTFHVITLFPESLSSYINSSIVGRAISDGYIAIKTYNPRAYTKDRLHRVDQKPYGGGPGMVIEAEPVIAAIADAKGRKKSVRIIFLSPGGEQFSTDMAQSYAYKGGGKQASDLIFVCGRYEGIDDRIREVFIMDDVSIGPFVITGGELGALIMIDSISRQIEGVLGNFDSREEARVSSNRVYTRPETFTYKGKKYSVPKVLLSGNHKDIDAWREGEGK